MKTRSEKKQDDESEHRQSPTGRIVYRAIYREGMEELSRDAMSLAWSGLAAGLAMGFSLVIEALLRSHLPDTVWRPLITKLGYGVGFLIIILGRQQLFTENTLTVILPLLRIWRVGVLQNVVRLWTVVFVANIAGAVLFAIAIGWSPVLEPTVKDAAAAIASEALAPGPMKIFLRGIFAGWLIALMVWLLPFADTAKIWVIIIITYLVGLAGFSHVIAGSVEVYALAAMKQTSWITAFFAFTVPALIGNIIGGLTFVGALSHAQFVEGEDVLL